MKNERQIKAVANEAARILKDNPHLKYYQAINRAKEVLKDEGRIQEFSRPHNTRTSNVDV